MATHLRNSMILALLTLALTPLSSLAEGAGNDLNLGSVIDGVKGAAGATAQLAERIYSKTWKEGKIECQEAGPWIYVPSPGSCAGSRDPEGKHPGICSVPITCRITSGHLKLLGDDEIRQVKGVASCMTLESVEFKPGAQEAKKNCPKIAACIEQTRFFEESAASGNAAPAAERKAGSAK